jgi:hypothetical protein
MTPPKSQSRPAKTAWKDEETRALRRLALALERLRRIDADMPLGWIELLVAVALHPERSLKEHMKHTGISTWSAYRGASAWSPEGLRGKPGYNCMVATETPPEGAEPGPDLRSLRRKYVSLNPAGEALVTQLINALRS